MNIKIKIGNKNYFVFLNKSLIIKQKVVNNHFVYTFFYLIHLLIKLGLYKFFKKR